MNWDDDLPKKRAPYEIGADLSRRSVEELHDYLAVLDTERKRVEAMLNSKEASRDAADSVFKR